MSFEVRNPHNTVLIDQDGVIADFDAEVVARVSDRYPHIQPQEPLPAIPHFYTHANYAEEHQRQVQQISNEPGFIEALPVVDGAVEGWHRIMDAGFVPIICSTPIPEKYMPTCQQEKIAWLTKHFGKMAAESAIFTPSKYLVRAAILIEDRPPPLSNSEQAVWEHVVFDRPCNRTPESQGLIRINSWREPTLEIKLNMAHARYLTRQTRGHPL